MKAQCPTWHGCAARGDQVRCGLDSSAPEPRGLDGRDDGKELGQACGLRVSGVRARSSQSPGELVALDQGGAALGDCRPAWQEDGRRRSAHELPAETGAGLSRLLLGRLLEPRKGGRFHFRPALMAELEQKVGPYRPWSTVIHDGGNEAAVIDDLTAMLDQHLRAVEFLMERCPWDLLIFRPDGHRPALPRALACLGSVSPPGPGSRGRAGGAVVPGWLNSGRCWTAAWGSSNQSFRLTPHSCS